MVALDCCLLLVGCIVTKKALYRHAQRIDTHNAMLTCATGAQRVGRQV